MNLFITNRHQRATTHWVVVVLYQCGVELWLPQVRSIDRSGEKSKHAMETQLLVRLYTRTRYNYGKTGRLHDTFNTPPSHKLRSIDRQSVRERK